MIDGGENKVYFHELRYLRGFISHAAHYHLADNETLHTNEDKFR